MNRTVRELQNSLTYSELTYWMAFWRIYPMGEEAMDGRFATLMAGMYTVASSFGKRRRKYKPSQFLPFNREGEGKNRPGSKEELVEQVEAVFTTLGMEKPDA